MYLTVAQTPVFRKAATDIWMDEELDRFAPDILKELKNAITQKRG